MAEELDEHGIKKIYKDSSRSDSPKTFIMGLENGLDNWRDRISQWEGSFSGSGLNTVFTWKNDQQRMNVYADPLKPQVPNNAQSLDRNILINREDEDGQKMGGWMAKSNDWRDYEVTAIEFLPDDGIVASAKDTSAWYGRGAKHSGNSIKVGSQGSAYKPDLWYAGNNKGWQVLKETLHFKKFKASSDETIREEGDPNVLLSKNIGNVKGKWFGIKTVVYNKSKKIGSLGSEYWPVMMETYVCDCDSDGNPDNSTWDLRFQCEDDPEVHGSWSSLPEGQPGSSTHTMSWGGPIITCRTDRKSGSGGGYPGMKFKKVSIREIQPGVKFDD
jgi:hypothetical protein